MRKSGCTLEPLIFESKCINEYVDSFSGLRLNTYRGGRIKLSPFPRFVQQEYHMDVDSLVAAAKSATQDAINVLQSYAKYLKRLNKTDNHLRELVGAARSLLEYHNVTINERQWLNPLNFFKKSQE